MKRPGLGVKITCGARGTSEKYICVVPPHSHEAASLLPNYGRELRVQLASGGEDVGVMRQP